MDAIPNQRAAAGGGSIAVPFQVNLPPVDFETNGYGNDGPDNAITFGFSDVTVYVQSSNSRLIPSNGLDVTEDSTSGFTLEADPVANRTCHAKITVSADNGDFETDQTFRITLTRGGG